MDLKPRTRTDRLLEISAAAMLPVLLGLWWWLAARGIGQWDAALGQWLADRLGGLAAWAEVLRWPIAKGWAWALGVLALGAMLRATGYGREALMVLGTQGAALLAHAALAPVAGPLEPRLDVLVYTSLLLVLVLLARRMLRGRRAVRYVTWLAALAWGSFILSLLASGSSPTVLLLSALLGVGAVVTLMVGVT